MAETFAVFGDRSAQFDDENDLVLLERVEVNTHSEYDDEVPSWKKAQQAVQFVVSERFNDLEAMTGEEFFVMSDVSEPMTKVELPENPPTPDILTAGIL